jgi:cell wall-associated NlpC family hydrolase
MVLGRRAGAPVWVWPVWVALLVVLIAAAAAVTRSDGKSEPVVPGANAPVDVPTTSAPSQPAAAPVVDDTLAPGRRALVTVAVANVWNAPGVSRPIDAPSLTNPVDLSRWIGAMTVDDKLWLVDRLVTQALYGERVMVRELAGDWARVVVTGQPTSLDPDGYPGWIPIAQLRLGDTPATPTSAVVTRPAATLRDATDPARALLALSFNTRLPVVATGATDVTVALPTGGRGLLAATEVDVVPPGPRPTAAAEVVAAARQFSGLPYLWAGTSGAGFDCSGFTAAVYGVRGIALPRDADDQSAVGVPVDRSRLQPGDLLFYAPNGQQSGITHVSMYVGDGMMIQAPATGRTVETVPVDTPAYARQFWGARRYLPVA